MKDDLIRRSDVIDAIESWQDSGAYRLMYNSVDSLKTKIIKLSSITQNGNEWISCSDRLPETDVMVLVSCRTKKGVSSINRAYYSGGFWHGSGSMSGVMAWMPLPEPYKEDQK